MRPAAILCAVTWVIALMIFISDIRKNGKKTGKRFFERLTDGIISSSLTTKMYSVQVKQYLRQLYPAKEIKELSARYYRDKWMLIIKIWFVGIHLILLLEVKEHMDSSLQDGFLLKRGFFGEDAQPVVLEVRGGEDGENQTTEISYEVDAQIYTPENIRQFTEKFTEEYESLICGENQNLQEVTNNLILKNSYDAYPMEFSWESSDYSLVDSDGTIFNEDITGPRKVTLTVVITYEETEYEHSFVVVICPKPISEADAWKKNVLKALRNADEKQQYTDSLRLPETIAGKKVSYEISQERTAEFFIVFLFVIVILLFYAKDNDLKKETEQRKQKLGLKYPEFISKFQLLLGAGMTVRNIFRKLSEDPSLGKELGEQLALLVRDMKNGLSEKEALDRFGKRTSHPLYMKFSALLVQNLKKGTGDLLQQLSGEASEAFALRKTQARQLGEEAGTKLLAPMILMLAIVMAILMIPAFLSFQI